MCHAETLDELNLAAKLAQFLPSLCTQAAPEGGSRPSLIQVLLGHRDVSGRRGSSHFSPFLHSQFIWQRAPFLHLEGRAWRRGICRLSQAEGSIPRERGSPFSSPCVLLQAGNKRPKIKFALLEEEEGSLPFEVPLRDDRVHHRGLPYWEKRQAAAAQLLCLFRKAAKLT